VSLPCSHVVFEAPQLSAGGARMYLKHDSAALMCNQHGCKWRVYHNVQSLSKLTLRVLPLHC
jgi:hypothetical protein